MSALKLTFVQADGVVKTIESEAFGEPLMEIARRAGVAGILGDCNGGCECGTCHVYVDPDWLAVVGPPDGVELSTLDMSPSPQRPNSRLSCQIKLRPELDGLKVTVAQ